jgi:fluoroquinolone transport system permease protein
MSRLWSTVRWEIRGQFRQGIYYAALYVAVVWIVALWLLPPAATDWLLPFAIFMDLSVFGVYFMAALLFLEKGERVLEALVVTPLRRHEYLGAKLLSLTLLALLGTLAVVAIHAASVANWLWLLVGVLLNSWILVLIGFSLAVRFNSISDFLIPSMLLLFPTQLPLLGYFGVWESWLLYLIPTQPAMLLIEAAFRPLAMWQLLYAFLYGALAGVVSSWVALRSFDEFIVRRERRRAA